MSVAAANLHFDRNVILIRDAEWRAILYRVEAGAQYARASGNGRGVTVRGSVGSAGDRPSGTGVMSLTQARPATDILRAAVATGSTFFTIPTTRRSRTASRSPAWAYAFKTERNVGHRGAAVSLASRGRRPDVSTYGFSLFGTNARRRGRVRPRRRNARLRELRIHHAELLPDDRPNRTDRLTLREMKGGVSACVRCSRLAARRGAGRGHLRAGGVLRPRDVQSRSGLPRVTERRDLQRQRAVSVLRAANVDIRRCPPKEGTLIRGVSFAVDLLEPDPFLRPGLHAQSNCEAKMADEARLVAHDVDARAFIKTWPADRPTFVVD